MSKSRLLTAVTAAAITTTLASYAHAQPYGPPPAPPGAYAQRAWDISDRINWLQERINRGRADGSIDDREYRRVQGELNGVRNEERLDRERNGGHLDNETRGNLERWLNHLNDQIHWIHVHDESRPW